MKTIRFLRFGLLLALAVGIFSTWNLVSAASGQAVTLTANGTGTLSKAGIAEVGGTIACGGNSTLNVSAILKQPVGRKDSVGGSFVVSVPCGPTPTSWTALVAAAAGKFSSGTAILTMSYTGYVNVPVPGYTPYPPYPGCSGYYYDFYTNTYYYQCYVNGTLGPQEVRLSKK